MWRKVWGTSLLPQVVLISSINQFRAVSHIFNKTNFEQYFLKTFFTLLALAKHFIILPAGVEYEIIVIEKNMPQKNVNGCLCKNMKTAINQKNTFLPGP